MFPWELRSPSNTVREMCSPPSWGCREGAGICPCHTGGRTQLSLLLDLQSPTPSTDFLKISSSLWDWEGAQSSQGS